MRTLTERDVYSVSGGLKISWAEISAGVAIFALGIAVVGTAGLALVPIGLAGAATAGELATAGAGLVAAAGGGAAIGDGLSQ